MSSRINAFALLTTLLLANTASQAADSLVYGKLGSGATAGSIGYGQHFGDDFRGRIGLGRGTTRSDSRDFDSNHYALKPESSTSLEAMVDWFPFSTSGFRVSGGLVYSNKAGQTLTASPNASGNYILNGHSYAATSVGMLQGHTKQYKLTPEIDLGWESAPIGKPGWRLISELNLSLGKTRSTTLSASGGGSPALAADLAAEQSRLAKDQNGGKFRLGASLGAAYSF